jgi:hypothetical protein
MCVKINELVVSIKVKPDESERENIVHSLVLLAVLDPYTRAALNG